MTQNPSFSIITVVYNGEESIARTIESVLNQTYAPYEYLVIDGASRDRSSEIARSYQKQFGEKGIRYQVVSEKDRGMYDALNKGAKLATGDLIGQINSDDWYELDALEKMADLYRRTDFDMAYADLRMIRADGSSWIKRARVDRFVNSRHWSHPTQFTRRSVTLQKPYACECMSDDLDFMLWVRSHGYRIEVLNETIANFTMQGMSHSRDVKSAWDRVCTKTRIYRRNGYSILHGVDVAVTELAKLVVGK